MMIIRPITAADTEAFIRMAFEASMGITSMPKNEEILLEKVALSLKSFAKQVKEPGNELYLFVLEDTETKTIGGTCGIIAKTTATIPFYFYRMESMHQHPPFASAPQEIPMMRIVRYYEAPTEICSLYLSPNFRKKGQGRLLSLSRFLFMASFLERFDKMVFAEMRGYIDKNNVSPFWEGVGHHFVDMEFETIMHLRDNETIDPHFAVPVYPIYLSLLSKETQNAIARVHDNTQPALNMLMQEGFQLSEEIDIFDGGPKVEAELQQVRTIQASKYEPLAEIARAPLDTPKQLICNSRLNFRACLSPIVKNSKGITVDATTAEALQVQVGDMVRYSPLVEN